MKIKRKNSKPRNSPKGVCVIKLWTPTHCWESLHGQEGGGVPNEWDSPDP